MGRSTNDVTLVEGGENNFETAAVCDKDVGRVRRNLRSHILVKIKA